MKKAISTDGNGGLTAGLLAGPSVLMAVLILIFPLLLLFRYSFNQYDVSMLMVEAFTLENYVIFINDPYYQRVLWRTIVVAGSCSFLSLVVGMPIAYYLARMESRWKSMLMLLVIIPLFIGASVRTVGWMVLFSRKGMLDRIVSVVVSGWNVELMYTSTAVIIGMLSIILPFSIITLQSVMEGISVRLEEAAKALGASSSRTFWHVVLPLSMPGIVTATTLSFILCMNAYGTPILLGGPRFDMMAPVLYYEFFSNNNWPFAAALAFILMAATLLLTLAVPLIIPRRYRA